MTVLDTVGEHVAGFNAADLERVIALFAEDAIFANADDLAIGRRAIRALFADAFAQPLTAALVLQRAVVEGDAAACELTETLRTGDGAVTEFALAAFYTVRAGELARVRVYRDLPA